MADSFAYESTGNDLFGIVDLNTGVFTPVGSTGPRLVGLGSYGGIIYGAVQGDNTLYSVNTSTGALTAIGTGNIAYGGFGSTTSGLYGLGLNGDLYSINPANGAATDLGPTGLSWGGIVMGMSAGSSALYLTQNNLIYSLDTTNGSATLIGTTNEGESGFGALVSIGGTLYGGAYGASTPDIYTIDPQTGTTTFVAASPSTPFAPGVAGFWGLAPTTSVADNWISSSSGNWTTVANWSSGVPNSNSDVVISKAGSYTVTLSNADTALSLSLNDSGATVSDNTGGSLKLAGGSGTLAINNGTFQLAGGSLQAGTISIGDGGTFLLAKGTYTRSNALSETIIDDGSLIDNTTATITGGIKGTGSILAENKANLTIAGTLTGSEIFMIANTAHVLITSAVSGTTGSFVVANKGVLEFGAADSENVTFASGASGTLKLDHSLTAPFRGTIFGLTPTDSIDLADLPWVRGKMTANDGSAGTLTVSNGSQMVSLQLSGNYTNATWVLSKDSTGGTLVADPPTNTSSPTSILDSLVTCDLRSKFGLDNQLVTTGVQHPGGPPPHLPPSVEHVVALFNQFMAAGLPGQNGISVTTPLSQIANEQQFLAQPHHG
jgi:hypothetical protein